MGGGDQAVISHHEAVRQMTSEVAARKAEVERLKLALADADTKAADLMEENNDLRKGMEEILDRCAN